MSYARFGQDGSDVYVIAAERGMICCMCALAVDNQDVICPNARTMMAHLSYHARNGHHVPDACLARLRAESPPYAYQNREECIHDGVHLLEIEPDGYCFGCGQQ
jgi:hypothetical protein